MESTSSCLCDTPDPADPTEYLERLKKKYISRTAKLQAQQQDLEKKIIKMEMFISKGDAPIVDQYSNNVPRIFPETPVRDVSGIPKTITDVIQPPISQPCSFFQKMMDNAKSILSIKCHCPSVAINKNTSVSGSPMTATTETTFHTTETTVLTLTDEKTTSEVPTKDEDYSIQQNVVDYDNTLTEKTSGSSCSGDFTDPSSHQEAGCTCQINEPEIGQQSSLGHTSSQRDNLPNTENDLSNTLSKSQKCPWQEETTPSVLISGKCSCENCTCDSLLAIDDSNLVTDKISSIGQKLGEKMPPVSVFVEKGETSVAEVQVAAERKEIHIQLAQNNASKCVTCCQLPTCPAYKHNLSTGIQASNLIKSKGKGTQMQNEMVNVGSTYSAPSVPCKAICNPAFAEKKNGPGDGYLRENQVQTHLEKPKKHQDGGNQCAFIGSPLLDHNEIFGNKSKSKLPCDCNTAEGPKKICEETASLTSADILEMQNIAEMVKKEKQMKAQIEELQKREQQYQKATKNVENVFTKTSNACCHCHSTPTSMNAEIEKISRELRLENEILKSELVEMKLELRHCLEKIEGPMKLKLQTEKHKCESLHKELQDASKNILLNQDAYSREMNQLKLQLCCACSNITDLNQMNQRLKDEMSNLDCLCQKLEDDLIKQKLNEAETIKRITTRLSGGNTSTGIRSTSGEFKCDSSLDVIARKLSKTIKDLAPCEECSKLPNELASAAKCIKDLTDMVRKRKVGAAFSTGGCNCQSGEPSRELLEECCTCCQGDTGDRSTHKAKTAEEKTVKTLLPVPESFVEKYESSKLDVDHVQSSYYSAREAPCFKIGTPCAESKATGVTKDQWPCSRIGEPCRKDVASQPLSVDKYCMAPCSLMMLPVKDQAVQEVPKFEKGTEPVMESTEEKDELPEAISKITESILEKVFETKPELITPTTAEPISEKPAFEESVEGLKTITEHSAETAPQKHTASSFSEVAEVEDYQEATPHPDATIGEELTEDMEEAQSPKEIPFQESRFGGEFPVDVANAAYSLAEPADVVHMTSIVTDSGTLQVVTTGPLGIIETTLTYTDDGQIEVVSGVYDRDAEEKRAAEAVMESQAPRPPISEDMPCTPEARCVSMEQLPGYEICDESKVCRDVPKKPLYMFPVDSSKISGVSGPEAETSYTTSAYESDLTSKIDTSSSGIRPVVGGTPDLTSAFGESSAPTGYPPSKQHFVGEVKDPSSTKYFGRPAGEARLASEEFHGIVEENEEELLKAEYHGLVPEEFKVQKEISGQTTTPDEQTPAKTYRQEYEGERIPRQQISEEVHGILDETVAQIVSKSRQEESEEAEGGTSTTGEVKSGEIFTPELGISDVEEEARVSAVSEIAKTVSSDRPHIDFEASGEIFMNTQVYDIELLAWEVAPDKVEESIHPDVSMEAGEIPLDETAIKDLDKAISAGPDDTMESAKEGVPCPPETSKTSDCGCQSKIQTDQSCQCCECKTIGISTSGDKETITEQSEEMGRALQEIIEDAKTDTDSEFVSISEATENIQAQASSIQKQSDVSKNKPEASVTSYFFENYPELIGKPLKYQEDFLKEKGIQLSQQARKKLQELDEIVIPEKKKLIGGTSHVNVEELLAKHPELAGVITAEQLASLKSLGTVPLSAGQEAEEILAQLLELATMSPAEQQTYLESIKSAKGMEGEDVALTEEILAKHPELATMSIADQQKSLKSLGYTQPSAQIHADSSLLKKHPQLAGKSIKEQQAMLKDLGYELPQPATEGFQKVVDYDSSATLSKIVDKALLDRHPELVGKTSNEQEEILKDLGYTVPVQKHIDSALLGKHPELIGKSIKEQQAMLKDLGYELPQIAFEEPQKVVDYEPSKLVDTKLLDKHPELMGKTSKEQEGILKELGYSVPAVLSTAKTPSARIHVDSVMLLRHPELVGKTPIKQEEILKELGYSVPAVVSTAKTLSARMHVDSAMLEKHPELVGKTSMEKVEILKELGYSVPAVMSAALMHVDSTMLQKRPELVGKTPIKQEEILKELGYSVPAVMSAAQTPAAPMHVDSTMLQKHPELVGKTSMERVEILKELGYSVPAVVSTAKTPPAQMHVDSAMLQKHPELVGKSPMKQEEILKELGYSVPAVVSTVKTLPAKMHIDSEMLQKHPELAAKTSIERVAILKELGYSVPAVISTSTTPSAQIHVDSVMLQKHPELIGKTSKEQEEVLKELGYSVPAVVSTAKAPSAPIHIDSVMLQKHPELIGKSSQEQKQILKDIGYAVPAEEEFHTPEQSSKDVSLTCKAPCRTTGTPTDDSSKRSQSRSSKSIPRLKVARQPSSREASISCKAPCRSKATIHSVTPKPSVKKIISIGDVSEAISQQQRPQSRDNSVSCKASCKTISVQSSRRKEVKELVAARSDTTATSSSLSGKENLKKEPKRSLEEVPSIVSQLSDKERPVIESTSRKPKISRRKRPKAFDCMKCVCNDPCRCEICTPGKKKSRTLKRTVRSCDCPPNMMMVPQMILMPPMQMSYSMPPTGHATNCRCNACIYRESIPSRSNVKGKSQPDTCTANANKIKTKQADTFTDEADAKIKSKHADTSTDEAAPRRKLKHTSSCECIDCLCMPKIKKLANTKEYPIVYDTKQIYQVKVKCDTCVNAQNAKRYLEQQARFRSRIPISTTTTNPPVYRPAVTNPAREGESSGSVYGSISCDCEQCKCSDCPDEKIPKTAAKVPPTESSPKMAGKPSPMIAGKPSSTNTNCCCKSLPCVCQPCTVEELTRKLKEAEDKLAAVQKGSTPQVSPPHQEVEDENCNCELCTCPRSDLMPKTKDAEEDEPCTCVECVCPGADLLKPSATKPATPPPPPTSAGDADHPPDCDCSICSCPAIDEYRKGLAPSQGPVVTPDVTVQEGVAETKPISAVPSAVGAGDEECACVVCECPGRTNLPPKPSESGSNMDSCDCSDCKCSPCEDPKKRTAPVLGESPVEDCDCSECLCAPCADPKKHTAQVLESVPSHAVPPKISAVTSQFTDMPQNVPHPPDCPCDECKCLEEIIQTESVHQTETGVQPRPEEKEIHGLQCACPECVCVECDTKGTHALVCKCHECECTDCPIVNVEGKPSAVAGTTSKHIPGGNCTCIKCVCDICEDGPKVKETGSQAATPSKAPPAELDVTKSHITGCLCGKCICVDCDKMEPGVEHVQGCQCSECLCVECPSEKTVPTKPSALAAARIAEQPSALVAVIDSHAHGECICRACVCVECKGKLGAKESERAAPAGRLLQLPSEVVPSSQGAPLLAGPTTSVHDEPCTCSVCDCKPCFHLETPTEECTCQVCTCVVCSKTLPEGTQKAPGPTIQAVASKAVEFGTHSPTCACHECQCGPGPQPKPKGNLGAEIDLHDPPPFELIDRIDCDCKKCDCIICEERKALAGRIMGRMMTVGTHQSHVGMMPEGYVAPPFEIPTRVDCAAVCKECTCIICNKEGPPQKAVAAQPSIGFKIDTQPSVVREHPSVLAGPIAQATTSTHSPICQCTVCTCTESVAQMQQAPSAHMPQAPSAHIDQASSAHMQKAQSVQMQQARSVQIQQAQSVEMRVIPTTDHVTDNFLSAQASAIRPQPSAIRPQPSEVIPIHCDCPTCTCEEDMIKSTTVPSAIRPAESCPIQQDPSTTVKPAASSSKKPDAPSIASTVPQTVAEGVVITASIPEEGFQSAETLVLPLPDIHAMYPEHPPARAPCDCPPGRCTCQPCNDKTIQPTASSRAKPQVAAVRTMDNLTLVKSIQAANKENCECKEQIEEIKRTLEKIRCSCNEAVYRSTQSMGQQIGSEAGHFSVQPFVKQASPFGQTMSGLKMALINLQDKCKAKDKMIEAMTAELAQRGDVEMFDKLLDHSEQMHSALDYDQAHDIQSSDRSRLVTNVIYAPTQVKDEGTVPVRDVASKSVEVRSHKHRKKPTVKGKESLPCDICDCSVPQLVQKEEKDCQKLDLTGFEVVDVRRITDDSLIVKWNAPKNQQVQGYDIFVNGTIASKVMSGTRTSAMMHSLDLSKSVQITIYAVTRCGRVDQPAIAIYEIKG